MRRSVGRWTNESVRRFAGPGDAVEAMTQQARATVIKAMDAGWSGPPFDPIGLAEILGIPVRPTEDVLDARLIPDGNRVYIEYNPNRPGARVNYSVAHEIVHTFFDDYAEKVRNRWAHGAAPGDEWQLEALCNVGAAEILMPASVLGSESIPLAIEPLLLLRKQYDVSMEAMLIRVAELAEYAGGMFAASRIERGPYSGRYRLDYVVASSDWSDALERSMLPKNTGLQDCTGIGYTVCTDEVWPLTDRSLHVEAVAIPPYPGLGYPRVVGIFAETMLDAVPIRHVNHVRGNALAPRGTGRRLIAHIVNDRTPRWGGGFALQVRRTYPAVQEDFCTRVEADGSLLTLGRTAFSKVDEETSIASMVAQRGYGPSPTRRLRYWALKECLRNVADFALTHGAAVHVPRIGAGQGGGRWSVIEGILVETLTQQGIEVAVYTLPEAPEVAPPEQVDMHLVV